ncbi:MAG: hypothetical protein SCK28_05805 [Bacillota bacterium]|nr:hypothetical protein [Bacillota bacterium]
MRKIVAVFEKHTQAIRASKGLTSKDLADYSLIELSPDYEQQVRQEVFLTHREIVYITSGALIGALIMGGLFFWLSWFNNVGILMARFLAGGLPSSIFTGIGIGVSLGGLLAGSYALSQPFERNMTNQWLLVLYCRGPNEQRIAMEMLKKYSGFIF